MTRQPTSPELTTPGIPMPDEDQEPEYLYQDHDWLDPDRIARRIDRTRDELDWAVTDVPTERSPEYGEE